MNVLSFRRRQPRHRITTPAPHEPAAITSAVPVPETFADGPRTLDRVLAGLRDLPAAEVAAIPDEAPETRFDLSLPATILRAVPNDGSDGHAKEILTGWPSFAGIRVTEAGQMAAGLWLGSEADASVAINTRSPEYLRELAAQARMAADALEGTETEVAS